MRILTTVAALIVCSNALAADQELTVEKVLSRAPVIRGDDTAIVSLHVRGTQCLGGNDPLYHFDLILQKPDHCSLILWDGLDQVPMLIAIDGKAVMYDAKLSALETFPAWPSFNFEDKEDQVYMGFGLLAGSEKPKAEAIKFDIKSVVNAFPNNLKLKRLDRGDYLLSGTSKRGNFCSCFVAPDEKSSYERLELQKAGETAPLLMLEQIEVNPHNIKLPSMPNLQELNSPLPIHQSNEPVTMESVIKMTQTVVRAMFFRRAIYRPDFRENPAVKSSAFIDWATARERDEMAAKALKGLATREQTKDETERAQPDRTKP